MTITTEQLDELERKLNERLYIPSKATWSVLIAIARAALAWREADRRLANAEYSIGDYDDATARVEAALDTIRSAMRGTP